MVLRDIESFMTTGTPRQKGHARGFVVIRDWAGKALGDSDRQRRETALRSSSDERGARKTPIFHQPNQRKPRVYEFWRLHFDIDPA